jgi:Uma2 family endonuclease
MVDLPRDLERPGWSEDGSVVLHGIPWKLYVALADSRGDTAGPRFTYLDGELEIMSPGGRHESAKKFIARLLEIYALEKGVPLNGRGSETFRRARRRRAIEPDECYSVGKPGKFPDLAIEVVVTHWGVDKLAVYEGLGVREVWVWRDGRITIYGLGARGYAVRPRSRVLPDLDVGLLASFVTEGDQTAAVRAYRERLRAG